MNFDNPWFLLLALLAIPVFAFSWWRRRRGVPLASTGGLAALAPTWRLRAARLLPLLRVAAVLLLAIALARPRSGEANVIIPAEGIDIALAIDISSSMESNRLGDETRLDVTKRVVADFINGRTNDRIGLVVFQKEALALSPPTLDYAALDDLVQDEDTNSTLLPDGTAIGLGLSSAVNMLRDSHAASRIVILLTDGEHNADSISPEDAAAVAGALKIRVYTIGVVDANPAAGPSGVDARLKDIAAETGGKYYEADSPTALADVYDEIGALERSRVGPEAFEQFDEYAPWFLGAAALLVVLEIVLAATWLRRTPA